MTTAPMPVRRVMPPVIPGICDTGQPARLYAAGWRCDKHRPTDPYRTRKETT